MNTKIFTAIILFASVFGYSQSSTFELDYSNINPSDKVIYNPNTLNVYKFGWGYNMFQKRARFFINLGYMNMKHVGNVEDIGSSHFENFLFGAKIMYKPFAKKWISRVQPIIQASYTSALVFKDKDQSKHSSNFLQVYKDDKVFNEGDTYLKTVYDPNFNYFSGGIGLEAFISTNVALNVMGNYDFLSADKEKSNGISFSAGFRYFLF